MMHIYKSIFISSLLILGLVLSSEVPAIDGDYGNPYVNAAGQGEESVRGAIEWNGSAFYGGMEAEIPGVTYLGGGMVLIGLIVGISALRAEKRRE